MLQRAAQPFLPVSGAQIVQRSGLTINSQTVDTVDTEIEQTSMAQDQVVHIPDGKIVSSIGVSRISRRTTH